MDRRSVLKAAVAFAGLGLAQACASRGTQAGAVPEGQPTLNVINASSETLAGRNRRFTFGVSTIDNEPVKGADLRVYLRPTDGGDVVGGPFRATFHDEGGVPTGLYVTALDVPRPGVFSVVAVDDDRWGEAAIKVVGPDGSAVPVPGDRAPAVATPTRAQPLGAARLCTRDPACGMHQVSLDDAVDAGRPVVLLFATPAYCQTAVCAPAVSTVERIRTGDDWGDVAFVHSEIFSDAGRTLLPAVRRWGLPTEPWLFTIRDGRVVDRLDGPMVGSVVQGMVSRLA